MACDMSTGKILSTLSDDYDRFLEESGADLGKTIQSGGTGGVFGNLTDSDIDYSLLFNEDLPMFHELPYRANLHLPSLLTKLGAIQVTFDHYHYWSWTAEMLREVDLGEDSLEIGLRRLFLHTVDFAVGRLGSIPINDRFRQENRQLRELASPHAKRAMRESFRAATQLSYPLLEGILRRLCSEYVDVDGSLKQGKKIHTMNGVEEHRASNLGGILYHYENVVAEDEIAASLSSLLSEMDRFSTTKSGYRLLNSWRHPHSHGGERFSGPEHVVLLNIASLLVWSVIPKSEYNEINDSIYSEKISRGDSLLGTREFDYYPLKETSDLISKYR